MIVKLLEIRDRATFIPAFAISTSPDSGEQRFLLRRAGYSCNDGLIIFGYLRTGHCQYDPYSWNNGSRTMKEAHHFIQKYFHELQDGDVIDVEFILGETTTKKISERFDDEQAI